MSTPADQPGSAPILISVSDIVNTLDVVASHETSDRRLIQTLITIDEQDLRNRLIAWGVQGFPTGYVLYSLQFFHLERCSDGGVRNDVIDYVNFLSPTTPFAEIIATMESKLSGMALSYSYTNDFVVSVHVSRK